MGWDGMDRRRAGQASCIVHVGRVGHDIFSY